MQSAASLSSILSTLNNPLWLCSEGEEDGLFGLFFQPEHYFSFTTFQHKQYFSARTVNNPYQPNTVSRLSGEISPSLSNPSFLQELRLSDNHFTGFIPEELGQLSRLRNMNVSRNSLGGNIPSTFGNCNRLQNLNLRRNNLQGPIPNSLGLCKELVYLLLTSNNLTGNTKPW